MSEKDRANLLAILDSCNKIQRFIKEIDNAEVFYADEKTFDAVLRACLKLYFSLI